MKPHESPESIKNQFVAIRAIRGLCGIGYIIGFTFNRTPNIIIKRWHCYYINNMDLRTALFICYYNCVCIDDYKIF